MIQAEVRGTKRPRLLNRAILQVGFGKVVTVPSAGKVGRGCGCLENSALAMGLVIWQPVFVRESRHVEPAGRPEPGSHQRSALLFPFVVQRKLKTGKP